MSSKAKQALINAFNELVVSRSFAEFHVADIIALADVSRSTFYAHFRSKEDLLAECLRDVVSVLATAGFDDGDSSKIGHLLEHFRSVSPIAKAYLNSPLRNLCVDLLAGTIEKRLGGRLFNQPRRNEQNLPSVDVETSMIAHHVAESTFGLIRYWLNSPNRKVDSTTLANRLCATTKELIGNSSCA